ncbi:hypothetical protein WJX79_002298 [Trebouxia sp. C0005]
MFRSRRFHKRATRQGTHFFVLYELMSEDSRIVLGVDGGATKTACAAMLLPSQQHLNQASAGPSNWSSVGKEEALQTLKQVVLATLTGCGKSLEAVAAICLGLAGVDSPEAQAALTAAIKDWFSPDVDPDIAGTGSIAFATLPDGLSARAAGCGPAFLDGGCGYDLGQKGLSAAAKGSDGRGPPTQLLSYLCKWSGVNCLPDLVRWVYAEAGWARIAALAPAVVACAQNGDQVAHHILQEGISDLVTTVQAVVKQLNMLQPFQLVLAGGLMRPGYAYTEMCQRALKQALPQANVRFPQVEAAIVREQLINSCMEQHRLRATGCALF